MRIALLIAGYLRSFEYNIDNLKKYIIQNNNVDIYIHITNDNERKYLNTEININKILKLLKFKYVIISENLNFNEDKNINNIINQNYKYYLLNEERKQIEKIENISYDAVFKYRPDVNINSYINFENIELDKIIIPSDSKIDISKLKIPEDKYICDIMAIGNPEIMNKYFDFYLNLNTLIENYGLVNETLLYYYLFNNNIPYKLIDIDYLVILSLFNTIGITGDSGSGKTMLTKILKDIFVNSFTLECDRYHKWERGDKNWHKYTHLNPNANYITKMQNDVFDLKIGKNIYQIDYDHKTGKFTDKILIESKENIIVCGLHSLYLKNNILNLKIYMDTDDNLRIPWKIKRDVEKRGYSVEKIYQQIIERKSDFEKFIKPQKEQSDIIIRLYTDSIFNIETFDINFEPTIYLKIGIKSSYNLSNFLGKLLSLDKIELINNFFYIYFKNINDYEEIIKTIILDLQLENYG
jgi:uridine kinase